jgi:hypothetical protein
MAATWVMEVGGLRIAAPITAGTNLLLAIQCGYAYRRLRGHPTRRARLWASFFLAMAVATLAGALKHGVADALDPTAFAAVLWVCSVASGVAVWCAQRATIAVCAGPHWRSLEAASSLQALVYLAANLTVGPTMAVVIANTAAGLLPVIYGELSGAGSRELIRGRIASGLSLSMFTGALYVAKLSAGPWLTHVDLAHALMGVSYWLILRGAAAPALGAVVLAPGRGPVYL